MNLLGAFASSEAQISHPAAAGQTCFSNKAWGKKNGKVELI